MSETKEHILKTSLVLFLQKSYRDVTMSEIVNKTGLSKGAFYHYFSSKEELFKEIASMFFSMGMVDYSSFQRDSFHSFYQDYVNFLSHSIDDLNSLVSDPGLKSGTFNFFLIMFEAISRFPEFLETELTLHKEDIKMWEERIRIARQLGEISSGSTDEEIAGLFLYCTDGVFIRYINSDKPLAYKEYLLSAFDTIYNNLKTK